MGYSLIDPQAYIARLRLPLVRKRQRRKGRRSVADAKRPCPKCAGKIG